MYTEKLAKLKHEKIIEVMEKIFSHLFHTYLH